MTATKVDRLVLALLTARIHRARQHEAGEIDDEGNLRLVSDTEMPIISELINKKDKEVSAVEAVAALAMFAATILELWEQDTGGDAIALLQRLALARERFRDEGG